MSERISMYDALLNAENGPLQDTEKIPKIKKLIDLYSFFDKDVGTLVTTNVKLYSLLNGLNREDFEGIYKEEGIRRILNLKDAVAAFLKVIETKADIFDKKEKEK